MRFMRLLLAAPTILLLVAPTAGSAQLPPADRRAAVELTVQLPVAVVRAEAAGVPADELRELVRELRRSGVAPAEAVELLRISPAVERVRRESDDPMGLRLSVES